MKKIFLFPFVVFLFVLILVPVYASEAELYSYNGVVLPPLPDTGESFGLYEKSGQYYLYPTTSNYISGGEGYSNTQYMKYHYQDGVWVSISTKITDALWIWSNVPLYLNGSTLYEASDPVPLCAGSSCPATDDDENNICDDCGFLFAVLREYPPFTIRDFMNHIGQILTSAVSWVSDVGAAIISQPLLLAFTALPLCGLGIAVFRRLKNTV